MKKVSILFILIAFAFAGNAQTSKITGSWLMTKAETSEGIQEPYQITDFNADGNMVIMGMDAGTWKYNQSSNTIVMVSDLDKDFHGEAKIVKITDKELVLSKDGVKMSYFKVDNKKIAENNKISGLFGSWEIKDQPYPDLTIYITFTEPDEFLILEKEPGMESRSSGTWIFDKQENSLIMIGLRGSDNLSGRNKILTIDEEKLEIEDKGRVFKASKLAQGDLKIERLAFTEDDFYNEDGDYKYYDDEEKLPWRDWSELKNGLLNVHQLIYKYSTLIDGTESFESKTLTADVNASLEKEGFNIDYIFNGFDRYNLTEDYELHTNTDFSNPLYPLEDDLYRIAGNEQIMTPAGTFDCTVLEVAGDDTETMKKLWMIDEKIGVYAKIIVDKPGSFGKYVVYELQEIK